MWTILSHMFSQTQTITQSPPTWSPVSQLFMAGWQRTFCSLILTELKYISWAQQNKIVACEYLNNNCLIKCSSTVRHLQICLSATTLIILQRSQGLDLLVLTLTCECWGPEDRLYPEVQPTSLSCDFRPSWCPGLAVSAVRPATPPQDTKHQHPTPNPFSTMILSSLDDLIDFCGFEILLLDQNSCFLFIIFLCYYISSVSLSVFFYSS